MSRILDTLRCSHGCPTQGGACISPGCEFYGRPIILDPPPVSPHCQGCGCDVAEGVEYCSAVCEEESL